MKKSLSALACLALLGAACTSPSTATVDSGEGLRLVPQTVDWRGDIGRDSTVMIDGEGQPSIVYLGLREVLEEGEIADPRPLHLAPTPNVLQANLESHGEAKFWNMTPVSWIRPQFEVPTGDPLLQIQDEAGVWQEATPNASVDSAMADGGAIHAAWTDSEGVKYASDASDTFENDVVARAPQAHGVGVAVDEGGQPWISYIDGNSVMLATPGDAGWITERVGITVVGSEPAARTRVAIDGDGHPVVAYPNGRSPVLANIDAELFGADAKDLSGLDDEEAASNDPVTSTVIEPNAGGWGISVAVDKDGDVHTAYYAPDGSVRGAHGSETFEAMEIAPAPEALPEDTSLMGTGIAVDDQKVGYITWHDIASNSVKMMTHDGGDMKDVSVPSGQAGATPSVVASPDGKNVWMSWYSAGPQNLMTAQLTDAKEITIAAVSPSPVVPAGAAPPAPAPECEPPTLDLTAPVGATTAGFEQTCLAADADKPFTIAFDNQDAGVPHNVAVYESDTATASLAATEIAPGVVQQDLSVDPLKAGEYFYKCDVHPTTMTGTLVIV